MILNLSIENDELNKKIKIAMDQYIEDLVIKELDETVAKYVEKRIDKLLHGKYSWDNERKIQGVYFDEFVRSKTEQALTEAIEKNAKEILAKKLASLI